MENKQLHHHTCHCSLINVNVVLIKMICIKVLFPQLKLYKVTVTSVVWGTTAQHGVLLSLWLNTHDFLLLWFSVLLGDALWDGFYGRVARGWFMGWFLWASSEVIFLPLQLYELDSDPNRKEFLDDLFTFMQKRGECTARYSGSRPSSLWCRRVH